MDICCCVCVFGLFLTFYELTYAYYHREGSAIWIIIRIGHKKKENKIINTKIEIKKTKIKTK